LSLKNLKIDGGSIIATYRDSYNSVECRDATLHQLSFENNRLIKEFYITNSRGYLKIIKGNIKEMKVYNCLDLTIELDGTNLQHVEIENCQNVFLKQVQNGINCEVRIFSKRSKNITVYFEEGILLIEFVCNEQLEINIPTQGRRLLICSIKIKNSSIKSLNLNGIEIHKGRFEELSIKKILGHKPQRQNIEQYFLP
jgi:hypothetical protein